MTYIYERKNAADLYHDLKRMDRDNFSYEGAKALMKYMEQKAEDCGTPIEYDPIALCRDFAEYKDLAEFNRDGYEYETIEQLSENTTVIEFDGGLIVQAH